MRKLRQGRGGFTLPEILVSITLLAVLAAVVVPAVASQIGKGDPTRVGNDMLAIRGAIEQFLSDVRKYPANFQQLTNQIKTTQTPLVGTFGSADSIRWRGPYLTKDSVQADSTGFSLAFKTPFDTVTLPTSGVAAGAGIEYLVLKVVGMDTLSWMKLDQEFDDGKSLTGTIRWVKKGAGGSDKDTLFYLALPVQ